MPLYNVRMVKFTRKEENTNTKIRSILRLLSAPTRYIKRKLNGIYKKLVKQKPDNGVNKLESSNAECNYMKYINNNDNTNVDNNSNTNVDNDTYDSEIRDKISNIRIIHSRLGNVVTKKDKKKLKKSFMK